MPRIENITIRYIRKAKVTGPVFQLLRKYGADIRYHNPHLTFVRSQQKVGPLSVEMHLKLIGQDEIIILDPSEFTTPEEFRLKLIFVGKEIEQES